MATQLSARPARPDAAQVGLLGGFVAANLAYAIWIVSTRAHSTLLDTLNPDRVARIGVGPDSRKYLAAATRPVWSLDFLAPHDGGPFPYALLLKLVDGNIRAAVIAQTLIAVTCWIALAFAVARHVNHRGLALVAFGAVLLFALHPGIVVFHSFIGTESLSLSLLALVLALAIRAAAVPTTRSTNGLALALVVFGLTRDANAMMLAVLAVPLAAVALTRRRRGLAAVAAVALATFVVSFALSTHAERSTNPIIENIAFRALGDDRFTADLVAAGMPLDESVRRLEDRETYFLLGGAPGIRTNPAYEEFVAWVETDGTRAYLTMLLGDPVYVVTEPWSQARNLLSPQVGLGAFAGGAPPDALGLAAGLVYPHSLVAFGLWTAAAAAGAAFAIRRAPRTPGAPPWWILGVVGTLGVVHLYLVWHGDALEVDRHSVTLAAQIRLTVLAASLWALGAGSDARGTPRTARATIATDGS